MEISVIIITKNEEKNIKRCLDSVLPALDEFDKNSWEVLVIDSASTDKTIEIVKGYNQISIFQISSNTPYMTAAMGRYLGAVNAHFDSILFLDGDMELVGEWLSVAYKLLSEDIDGIVGDVDYFYVSDGRVVNIRENYFNIKNTGICKIFGGAVLIKKNVLISSGNFNPYIKSNEELELYSRLKKNKFKIIQIPHKMANHYTKYLSIREKLFSVLNTDVVHGRSLAFYKSFATKSTFQMIVILKQFFVSLLVDIMSLLLILISLITAEVDYIIPVLMVQCLLFLVYFINRKVIHFIIDKIIGIKFLMGLTHKHDDFPLKYKRIK